MNHPKSLPQHLKHAIISELILILNNMDTNKEYLTQEKFDEFKTELAELKGVKRKEIAENLEYAKALGDLSENAEYHEARDMQANIEDRIAKLEELLKNAVIVNNQRDSKGIANIGSTVSVVMGGKQFTYTIVGSEESDVIANKISIKSPFGQAIIGKKKGDAFSYKAPNGVLEYTVVSVE
jgi:transcription elongation factor GreA